MTRFEEIKMELKCAYECLEHCVDSQEFVSWQNTIETLEDEAEMLNERDYEFFTHKNGVVILEDDCIFWFDSLEIFLDEELNQTNGSSCKYENEDEARKEYEQEKSKHNSAHEIVGED